MSISKNDLTVFIDKDGSIKALNHDDFPFQELGKMTVERASTIEFDHTKQRWTVCDTNGNILSDHHVTRAGAIAWEQNYFINKLRGE